METNAAGQVVKQAWYFNGNFPWLGMLFCAPIIGLWYWCTDQYIVQRALGAPNETDGAPRQHLRGVPEAVPGLPLHHSRADLLRARQERQGARLRRWSGRDGQAIPAASHGAFPLMVQYLLPPGLRGIVVAGLLSALMGSLAGVFNACSTLFTVDLYQKWKPDASQAQLVRTGRIATAVMVLIALAWIPVIQGAHGLYNYLQAVQGYLAPPIFVVFFLGVFWKRLNAAGLPVRRMIVGFALGVFRMVVDTPVTLGMTGYQDGYAPGSFLWIVNNIYFQYFSVCIFLVSATSMIAVSYLTTAPSDAQINGADVRDRDARAAARDASQLEPLGRHQLRDRPRADRVRVHVLLRLEPEAPGLRLPTPPISRRSRERAAP